MSRRNAIITAVEAHNRTHPAAPLPRPAARRRARIAGADSTGGRALLSFPRLGDPRPDRDFIRHLQAQVVDELPIDRLWFPGD
jgi:hypothetical protein